MIVRLPAFGLLIILVVGALTACGGAPSNDPLVRGKQVYDKGGCSACHTLGGQGGTLGPDQSHLATVAAERLKDPNYHGQAANPAGYIRESIVSPGAYVVPNYPANLMPTAFGQQLSAQELDDLVTYLLTMQ